MDVLEDYIAADHDGEDESIQLIQVPWPYDQGVGTRGWLALTRYKHRGRCTSAVHVGDFFPPRPFTLELAETILAHGWKNAS